MHREVSGVMCNVADIVDVSPSLFWQVLSTCPSKIKDQQCSPLKKRLVSIKCLLWSPCSTRYFSVVLTLSLCNPTKAGGLAMCSNRVGGTIILLFNICLRFAGMELKNRENIVVFDLAFLTSF